MGTVQKLTNVVIAGGTLMLAAALTVNLSANPSGAPGSTQSAMPAATATPARELVSTYCASCHNERLKTANLMLDKADAGQPANWPRRGKSDREAAQPRHAAAWCPATRQRHLRPDANWLESELIGRCDSSILVGLGVHRSTC
jgi:cytochrome c5